MDANEEKRNKVIVTVSSIPFAKLERDSHWVIYVKVYI